MAWFEKDFIAFFSELEKNNNKEWFADNKKRFEKNVKEPFYDFVAEMIGRIQQDDKTVEIQPKDAIFRIYRDVRFSKDKTPYKTHVSAVISPAGRKNLAVPGAYFECKADGLQYYGGAYYIEREHLEKLRASFLKDFKKFKSIITSRKFLDMFGEIAGEKNKRLPKEFTRLAEKEPLVFNKTFYYGARLGAGALLADDLADKVYSFYETGKPFNTYFRNITGTL